ncbi:hypothetical protein [Thiolapillus sp.]
MISTGVLVSAGFVEINKFGILDANPVFAVLSDFGILCRTTPGIHAVVANGISIAGEGRVGLVCVWYPERDRNGCQLNNRPQ